MKHSQWVSGALVVRIQLQIRPTDRYKHRTDEHEHYPNITRTNTNDLEDATSEQGRQSKSKRGGGTKRSCDLVEDYLSGAPPSVGA